MANSPLALPAATSLDAVACGVLVCECDGSVSYANARAERILGLTRSDLLGRQAFAGGDWQAVRADGSPLKTRASLTERVLATGKPLANRLLVARHGGRERWLRATVEPLMNGSSRPSGVLYTLHDATAERRAEQKLADQRLHDPLTALPNRVLLIDRLKQATAIASRNGGGFALLLLDIDGFKDVNLAFGHRAGDVLLARIGTRLSATVRAADSVCRIAGDEFAVILWDVKTEAQAMYSAQRILQELEKPFELNGQEVELFASAGVALYPTQSEAAADLITHGYSAMYTAKREHLGCLVYDGDQDSGLESRFGLRGELRRAIAGNELVVYYQPKVAFARDDTPCVEALVRWQHPERGFIPPDQFIPLAEETGLIRPLGDWVLNASLAQARRWRDAGLHIGVAVNLSMHNLQDPNLVETIKTLLARWDVPPSVLKLEVTESSIASHPERVLAVLQRLRDIGVELSIDDFGTGYSSLMQLKQLPVAELKIDKSFVQGMLENDNDHVIVRTTIDLGHNLGLAVVAEGVEDAHMWDTLQSLGCDTAQGYYMARPMAADQLELWMRESPWAQRLASVVA